MNRVEQAHAHLGIWRGTTLFLPKPAALQFIDACWAAGIPILGVDGVIVQNEIVHLSLDHLLDLSSTVSSVEPGSEAAYHAAKLFVETRPDDIFFEIVCDD